MNSNTILGQRVGKFFCKGPDDKDFRLCGDKFFVPMFICPESKQEASG